MDTTFPNLKEKEDTMQPPLLDADSLFEDLMQDLPPETAQMAAVSYSYTLPLPPTPCCSMWRILPLRPAEVKRKGLLPSRPTLCGTPRRRVPPGTSEGPLDAGATWRLVGE